MPSRRQFLLGSTAILAHQRMASAAGTCPFRLAVINDEISDDFDHACYVAKHDFGLDWIELRSMWKVNVTDLNEAQIAESKKIIAKYNLRVTDIASPLFKTDLPGAPLSKESPHHDEHNAKVVDYAKQDALLEHCIDLCKSFGTERIRCFDFWRLEDQGPYRAEINRKLNEAATACGKQGLILLLENEMACNTGSGEEAAAVLRQIPNRSLMLNWDPGNAGTFPGNDPVAVYKNLLPKDRIGHVHCKNVKRMPGDKFEWQPVDVGLVDWPDQLRALAANGYHDGVSLETHWKSGKGPEDSTRISMQGLKSSLAKAGINCPS